MGLQESPVAAREGSRKEWFLLVYVLCHGATLTCLGLLERLISINSVVTQWKKSLVQSKWLCHCLIVSSQSTTHILSYLFVLMIVGNASLMLHCAMRCELVSRRCSTFVHPWIKVWRARSPRMESDRTVSPVDDSREPQLSHKFDHRPRTSSSASNTASFDRHHHKGRSG
jgi:hypothetical protein